MMAYLVMVLMALGTALNFCRRWGLELLAGLVVVLLGLGLAMAPHIDSYLLTAGMFGLAFLSAALARKYL